MNVSFLRSRFPSDVHTYSIDEQFLWGSALMIIPVLEEVRFGCEI
jgi:alpha-glucosidase (family GH31 glycosyl hydrolase)